MALRTNWLTALSRAPLSAGTNSPLEIGPAGSGSWLSCSSRSRRENRPLTAMARNDTTAARSRGRCAPRPMASAARQAQCCIPVKNRVLADRDDSKSGAAAIRIRSASVSQQSDTSRSDRCHARMPISGATLSRSRKTGAQRCDRYPSCVLPYLVAYWPAGYDHSEPPAWWEPWDLGRWPSWRHPLRHWFHLVPHSWVLARACRRSDRQSRRMVMSTLMASPSYRRAKDRRWRATFSSATSTVGRLPPASKDAGRPLCR